MTVPKVQTIKRGSSRFYVDPSTDEKVPGVTSILGEINKSFLQFWAAKLVAEFAVDNFSAYSSLVMNGQREAAVEVLKGAPRRYTKERADIGSEAHDLFERIAIGEDIGQVHSDLQPYVDHFNQFLSDFRPQFLMNEETVWSAEHRYAGSFDAIAEIAGDIVVLDYKTSKAVYEDTALQLAAYKNADFVLRPDGSKVPLPEVTHGAVVHITPEGYSVVPMRVDDDVFGHFLALRYGPFEWSADVKKTVKGRPLAPIFGDDDE